MVPAMNTAAMSSDWVGRVIEGRYPLLQWLGGSASGGVFLTELPGPPSRQAAIKLVPADTANAEARIAGWAAATALSHPHLMGLFASGRCQIDDAALLYAVTEYAEENLAQILPDRPLTPTEAREMLAPVLDALAYLHGKGFAHGHLKPSNIMVVDNQLKLSVDSLQAVGKPGAHFPPPSIYDAPERATGAIAPATDVWSLGVTLVETLTQHPPVWEIATNREPVVPESMPQPFAEIAHECLRRDPLRRYTLRDVKARLEPAPPDRDRQPARPDRDEDRDEDRDQDRDQPGKTGRTAPARLRVMTLIGAVLVLLAVIAAVYLRSHKTRSSSATEDQQAAPKIAAAPPESPVPGPQAAQGATVKGAVAERVLPDVPRSASATIWGTVVVKIRVTVDSSGKVSNATFESPGPSKYFANLALQAARNWRFKPARVDGQAVSGVWMLQFQFRQDATEVAPVEVSP